MKMVIIFDTETTGLKEPALIEAGWARVCGGPQHPVAISPVTAQRFDPGKPIESGATATHHILAEDLVGCPPASSFRLPDGVTHIIGHNIDFDWTVIGRPDVKRICTKALATYIWPGLDSYSQNALLYHWMGAEARKMVLGAHAADVDVTNNAALLGLILGAMPTMPDWDALWAESERARVPTVMPFGKHKGVPIKQVPADYRRWLANQQDVDEYLLKALRA